MNVITLLNEKGGVGKTTLAIHISAGLAARGMRVMLIDSDPQAHSTIRMGMKKAPGLYDLLVRDAEWNEVTAVIPPEKYGVPGDRLPDGRLLVVPSNVETRSITSSMGSNTNALRERIGELEGHVDVVVVDTIPTPSLLHGMIYIATTDIIYPTTLSFTSFDGLVESITHKQQADQYRLQQFNMEHINVAGIVPTMYRRGTIEQDENLAKLRDQFHSLVWHPMALRTLWTETEREKLPVWSLEPSSAAAADAWELVDCVEGMVKHVPA